MIQAVTCPGRERAVKILHITGQILVFETWSGKPEPGTAAYKFTNNNITKALQIDLRQFQIFRRLQ